MPKADALTTVPFALRWAVEEQAGDTPPQSAIRWSERHQGLAQSSGPLTRPDPVPVSYWCSARSGANNACVTWDGDN